MKIITWNCNMAFRKKARFILSELPDILIVPECENIERLIFEDNLSKPTDVFWYGDNLHKGIGVFSYSDFKIKLLDVHNPDFKFVIPLSVSNDMLNFTLFAIWSQKPENHDNYTEQVYKAVHYYADLLASENVIIAGDFNSNTIWDKPRRVANHSSLVDYLTDKNIVSAYHHFHKQEQGKEKDNTLFMQKKIDRPYHIDYCFASSNLIDKLSNVVIGDFETWTKHSDHNPLIVSFNM